MKVYLAQRSIKLDYYSESACCWICAFRSAQVLPEGTAWTSDDSPALWWMDSGLKARLVTILLGIKSGDKYSGIKSSGPTICSVLKIFVFSFSVSDPDKRLQALWVVCNKLPKNNKTNLRSVKRKTMTAWIVVEIQHERLCFHADIWWSFCPSWLTTAKQTRWRPATSPSCWDPICCGPRLRGEWWLNTEEGCYCSLCLAYTSAHSPSHFNPPQESGWDGSSYFCACRGHRGAHNPACWLVLSWGWALGLLLICPRLVDSHDLTTDKCGLIKRCCLVLSAGATFAHHTCLLLTFYFGKTSPLQSGRGGL